MENQSPSKFEKALLVRTPANPDTDDKVGVRKPNNDCPIRVHPDPAMSPSVYLMTRKSTGDPPMLVLPEVVKQVPDEPTIAPHRLYLCKDSLGKVFFWHVKDTASTGSWQKSAHQLAGRARERWTRVKANLANGRYEVAPCHAPSTDVSWPEISLFKLLEEAFGDDVIERADDDRVTGLRGGGTVPQ